MKHPYENEEHDKHGQKVDELKVILRNTFVAGTKNYRKHVEIHSKSFGNKLNYNSQTN